MAFIGLNELLKVSIGEFEVGCLETSLICFAFWSARVKFSCDCRGPLVCHDISSHLVVEASPISRIGIKSIVDVLWRPKQDIGQVKGEIVMERKDGYWLCRNLLKVETIEWLVE